MTPALFDVADSIVYVSLLLADQPRRIDTVIDYFGGGSPDSAARETAGEAQAHGIGGPVARIASTAGTETL